MERSFGFRCMCEEAAGAEGGEGAVETVPHRPSPLKAFFTAVAAVAAIGLVVPDGGVAEAIGAWAWLGLVPLATGLMGWCPPYAIFGINTCKVAPKQEQ